MVATTRSKRDFAAQPQYKPKSRTARRQKTNAAIQSGTKKASPAQQIGRSKLPRKPVNKAGDTSEMKKMRQEIYQKALKKQDALDLLRNHPINGKAAAGKQDRTNSPGKRGNEEKHVGKGNNSKGGEDPLGKAQGGRIKKSRSPSKSPSGSAKGTPLKKTLSKLSPKTAEWFKKDHKLVRNGKQIDPPEHVRQGRLNRFPNVARPDTKALKNPNITCYRNATIQALLHVPAFYRLLGKFHKDCSLNTDQCVVCALQALAHTYWDDAKTPRPPRGPGMTRFNAACRNNLPYTDGDLNTTFTALKEEFINQQQADASDFLEYLLDVVRKASDADDPNTYATLFDLELVESWTCEECGEGTRKHLSSDQAGSTKFVDVSIREPQSGEMLTYYLNYTYGSVRRHIYCDNSPHCSKKYPKSVKLEKDGPLREIAVNITKLPQILIIKLKRFGEYDVKFDDNIFYEEHLNLRKYVQDPDSADDAVYRLDAVVAHQGEKISGGHFVAAVRDVEDPFRFLVADDHRIDESSSRFYRMRFPFGQHPKEKFKEAHPYLLFYSKL